jgi:hypothetical protein
MFTQQSIIIARMKTKKDLIILMFDVQFTKIIDGMICKEKYKGPNDIEYEYTTTFNNWMQKKHQRRWLLQKKAFIPYVR